MTLTPDAPSTAVPGGDPLEDALRDPQVRASLAVLAAHAPELAVLVSMGNGLLGRSREIVDNVNERVNLVREGSGGSDAAAKYTALANSLADATPTIDAFLNSPILRPEIVAVIGKFGEAALEADRATRGKSVDVGGVFALMRQLKDPKVQETLAFFVTFAQAFGRDQATDTVPVLPTAAKG